MNRAIKSAGAALLALGLAACADDPSAVDQAGGGADGGAFGAGGGAGSVSDPASIAYFNEVVGDRVFFALDSASVDASAADTLTRQARWLAENPAVSITLEGHADERGTREYNLALGARRAQAARDFLIAQGVSASRMTVVSFGKERPVAGCSNESCWTQNRRAVTVAAGAPTS